MTPEPENIRSRPGFDFAFDPGACATCPAHCCRGTSGHVYLSESQIKAISEHLSLERDVFIKNFTRMVGRRYALQEIELEKGDFACIFLEPVAGQCTVYEARPTQCRTFPFWEHFRIDPEEVDDECPGILKDHHSSS